MSSATLTFASAITLTTILEVQNYKEVSVFTDSSVPKHFFSPAKWNKEDMDISEKSHHGVLLRNFDPFVVY